MSKQQTEAYERALHYMETHPTDEIVSDTPLLVGTDPNGYAGIVFGTKKGMAVEVNMGLPTGHGKTYAKYVPVAFAKAIYR